MTKFQGFVCHLLIACILAITALPALHFHEQNQQKQGIRTTQADTICTACELLAHFHGAVPSGAQGQIRNVLNAQVVTVLSEPSLCVRPFTLLPGRAPPRNIA